nr:hypothetical protein [Tanacetum cinerariifolium]
MESSTIVSPIPTHMVHIDHPKDQILEADSLSKEFEQRCIDQRGAAKADSTNSFNTVSNLVNAAIPSGTFSAGGPSSPHPDAFIPNEMLLYRAVRLLALEVVAGCLPLAKVYNLVPAVAVGGGVTVVSELIFVFRILALVFVGVAPVATA